MQRHPTDYTAGEQGDCDLNGTVDVADFGGMASNYGSSLANGSGEIFPIVRAGELSAQQLAGVGSTVPEPAFIAIANAAIALSARRARRRHSLEL